MSTAIKKAVKSKPTKTNSLPNLEQALQEHFGFKKFNFWIKSSYFLIHVNLEFGMIIEIKRVFKACLTFQIV